MKIKELDQSVKGLVEVCLSVKLYRPHASVPRYKSLKHIVRMLLDLLIIKFIIISLLYSWCECVWFVSTCQPCEELPSCPGSTPALSHWQLGQAPAPPPLPTLHLVSSDGEWINICATACMGLPVIKNKHKHKHLNPIYSVCIESKEKWESIIKTMLQM